MLLISLTIYSYPDYGYRLLNDFQSTRNSSLGLVPKILELNQLGLYIVTLILIPKLMMNLFGEVVALNFFDLKGYSVFIQHRYFLLFIKLLFI